MTIIEILISFYVYSFLGWFYESTLCSMYDHKHFINRGFLLGPYCPVYGVGATACYLCFNRITNPFLLFLASALLCGVIEYFTGYAMEKIFHAKWWDYSDYPFQLHGRVCLYGLILFGSVNVILCLFIQPRLLNAIRHVHSEVIWIIVLLITVLFIVDFILTIISWTNLNKNLKLLHEKMFSKTNQTMEEMSDYLVEKIPLKVTEEKSGLKIQLENMNLKLKRGELRFMNAFRSIKIPSYDKSLKRIQMKEHVKNIFDKM